MHDRDHDIPAGPMLTASGRIGQDVIDANGHMNVAGFDRLFDQAETAMFLGFGIGDDYIRTRRLSVFRLEKFIRYEREMMLGHPYQTRSWVIGTDGRLIHHFHELWDCEHDRRSAFYDCLAIHVDLDRRKSAAIADPAILNALRGYARDLAVRGLPEGALPRGYAGMLA